MSDTFPEPIEPFISRRYRRDVLGDLANAPLEDVESAINRILGSTGPGPDPKKDGKDGAADGIVGLAAGGVGEETGKEATDDTGKESTDDTGKEATDDTGKEQTDTTGKEATDKPGKDSVADDLIHWYTNTFNVKNTKDAVDDDPKGFRDTTMEMPSDFEISAFNVGNTHDASLSETGATASLDEDRLRLVEETHSALLEDLLRPDRPII
jgi:hypothetical protein